MDQKTDAPVIKKPGKSSQLELEPKSREQLLQETAPHIDPDSPAYQADMGKIDAIATAERAKEILAREDFDWNTDDAVILKEQRATAVYHNKLGELVIRQKAAWDDDEDTFIYVTLENCNAFIDGIAARIRRGGGQQ